MSAKKGARAGAGSALQRALPVTLLRASHPKQALLFTAVAVMAAALAGRSTRELGLVAATVVVGQVILGWHNDLVDATRDRAHARDDKPVAAGLLDPSTLAFSIAVAVLLVIPLSIANGLAAGLTHLAILAIAMAGNAGLLRRGRFSYLPWMATFGLFPAFLSYGGWGGDGAGGAPTIAITVAAALLGIGVHVLCAMPGLVNDNKDGFASFPLTLALRTGAPRLLGLASAYTAVVSAAIVIVALTVGLVQ